MSPETPPQPLGARRERPRFARAIAIALLAHLPVLLLARQRSREPAAPPSPPSTAELALVDIEPPAREAQHPSLQPEGPGKSAPERRASPRAISSPPSRTPQEAPAPEVAMSSPTPATELNGARSEYDPAPPDSSPLLAAPGLGGPPLWTLPDVITPPSGTAPPALRPINEDAPGAALRQAMAENDRAHGVDLPGARAIASAVAEASRGPDAPRVGRATFAVRVDQRGRAVGVSLVNAAAGDAKAWALVANNAAASIKGRSFALGTSFARGARVNVDVVAAMVLPSGPTRWFNPKRMLDDDMKPLPKPRSPDDVNGSAGNVREVPEKIAQLRIVNFDVTNFGAKERHNVKVSFRVDPVY